MRMAQSFRLAGVQWPGKKRYCAFQKKYLAGKVNEAYNNEKNALVDPLRERGFCYLSCDGTSDSPGQSAKYLNSSMFDQATNTIVLMTVTQVTEAGNDMEKLELIKNLNNLKEKNVQIKQTITYRHTYIRKYISQEQKGITQQFDVWYFCKNIRKKLGAAAEKKLFVESAAWNKPICNHLCWVSATCR